jgi:hypothetical protein
MGTPASVEVVCQQRHLTSKWFHLTWKLYVYLVLMTLASGSSSRVF